VCVALGGFRKRAVDIAVTSIALILIMPILLATAGLVRLLVGKAVFEVDKRIGFGGKRRVIDQGTCERDCVTLLRFRRWTTWAT
jgi:lipopolysaccharide/colanic/teichoic acid biosynthesis glycosyltransferase